MPWCAILLECSSGSGSRSLVWTSGVIVCILMILMTALAVLCHVMKNQENEDVGKVREREIEKRNVGTGEVVLVQESPQPTRTMTSPFTPTPSLARRRRLLCAERGGGRRIKTHSRVRTRIHNPSLPHHCGYSCALRASRRRVTLAKIVVKLRHEVALRIQQAFYNNETKANVNIRKLVLSCASDLDQYLMHVKSNQWASIVELSFAADILNTSYYVAVGKNIQHVGVGDTNHVLVLAKSHYVLMKMHRKEAANGMTDNMKRGGMHRSWAWNEDDGDNDMQEVPDWAWSTEQEHRGARIVPAEGVMHVDIGASLRTDIRSMTMTLPNSIRVGEVRTRLAWLLGTTRDRLMIASYSDPTRTLPDWIEAPANIYVEDTMTQLHGMDYVTFHFENINEDIILPITNDMQDPQIRLALARVSGLPLAEMSLRQRDGRPWTYAQSRSQSSYVIVMVQTQRGGMEGNGRAQQRSRSRTTPRYLNGERTVSTTLPGGQTIYYRQQSSSSSSPEPSIRYAHLDRQYQRGHSQPAENEVDYQDLAARLGPQPCLRSPTPRPVQEPELHGISPSCHLWSHVWPETLPPAQPNMHARPLYMDDQVIGVIHGAEGAIATHVLAETEREIMPCIPMWLTPTAIRSWENVVSMHVSMPRTPRCERPHDLRELPWEHLQKPRCVPVLERGRMTSTLIISAEMTIAEAQNRVQQACAPTKFWQLLAINHDHWIVQTFDLPEWIQEQLEELQALRAAQSRWDAYGAQFQMPSLAQSGSCV